VNLQGWPETMAYLMVFVSTMVEGEVVFVGASAMVSLGLLNPFWVFAAAAAGGSAGDQLFYYALRGRLRFRLERWAWFRKRAESVRDFVLTNATLIILCSRFRSEEHFRACVSQSRRPAPTPGCPRCVFLASAW